MKRKQKRQMLSQINKKRQRRLNYLRMEKRYIIDTDVIQICFNNLCSKLKNTKEIYFIDSYSIPKIKPR